MNNQERRKRERSFWDWTGQYFPSLTGAPSTQYYLDCETSLFLEFCPQLKGKKVFKTDLWDEAKNTQILHWISKQGASVFALDISTPVVKQAETLFIGVSGVLFMPGLFRMLDLFLHVYLPWATKLSAPFIVPFAWLYKSYSIVRRHSYLICIAARRPQQPDGS